MVLFGDEDNMVERFVEIGARVFLEGTAHVVSGFSVNGPENRVFAAISLRSKVLTEGYIAMAYILTAYTVIAHIVMAYIATAI